MTKQVNLSMDEAIKKKLEEMAKRKGMKLQEYIKDWVLTGFNIDEDATESSRLQLTNFRDAKAGEILRYRYSAPKKEAKEA